MSDVTLQTEENPAATLPQAEPIAAPVPGPGSMIVFESVTKVYDPDVTALREAGVGSDFRLVLDTGTFHGLTDAQRTAMGREIDAVAADDATVLLDCFAPRRRGPLPRGASQSDVEAGFPGWEITDIEVADSEPDAIARLLKFDEHFYRLRRR